MENIALVHSSMRFHSGEHERRGCGSREVLYPEVFRLNKDNEKAEVIMRMED